MIQHGYSFMRYTPFDWRDSETYLSVFIRFFDNIWNWILGRPYCKYSHAGNFCLYEGELWVYEAIKKGFCRTYRVDEYFKKYSKCSFIILIPLFDFDKDKFARSCEKLCGVKYDDVGLLALAEYLASDERIYLGRKNEIRVVCTSGVAVNYHNATKGLAFPEPFKTTPLDLFNSELFNKQTL